MELHIRSPQSSYINGEKVRLEVAVRNVDSAPLTVPLLGDPMAPQPYVVIRGPSYPTPFRFHWRGQAPTADQSPIETSTVAPGDSVTDTLVLPASLQFPVAGVHEVFATYERDGTTVESNHIDVKIEAAGPPVYRFVGYSPMVSLLGIQALSVNGSSLYLAAFTETRPDLGETAFRGTTKIADVDAGATDFFAPWCQSAEPGANGPRFGWRNGNTITVAGFRKLPQRIALPFAPRIHGPSLMDADGNIDRLVTDGAGTRLALVRFPAVGYDQPPPAAAIVWERTLSEPAIDLIMSINPAGAHAAVLRFEHGVQLLSWDANGPTLHEPVAVAGRAVSAVLPALHLSVSGVMRATVVSAESADSRRITFTEVVWRPGAAPDVRAGAPVALTSPVRSGTVAYSMGAVESPRRDWMLVLESHRVLTSLAGGNARVFKREVIQPPHILVMSNLTYYLEVRARPALVLLD